MNLSTMLFGILCLLLLLSAAALTWYLLRQLRLNQQSSQTNLLSLTDSYVQLLREQGERDERIVQLTAAKDAVTYSALTSMTPTSQYDVEERFDPSDEAEAERLTKAGVDTDGLDINERDVFDDIGFDPLINPGV